MAHSEIRLAGLSGLTLTLYRGLMIALLAIAVLGFGYTYQQQKESQGAALPFFAAGLRFPGGNESVTRVAPFSEEAHRKGVLPGDRLIAIDGRNFPFFDYDALQASLSGPDGSTYRLTIQTREQPARTIVLTRSSHYIEQAYAGSGLSYAGRSWTVFAFQILDGLLAFATALLLFLRKQRDPVAAMLALCAVPFSDGVALLWPDAGPALFFFSIARHTLFLAAILVYPDGRFVPRWTVWLTPAIPVIELMSVHSATDEAAIGLRQILLFGFMAAAVAAFVVRYRATPPGAARQQVKFVMLGGAGWMLFGLVSLALERMSQVSGSVPTAAWLSLGGHLAASLAAMALEGGILLSLLRLRLYDADMLISRSAAYTVLTLILGPSFAATDKIVQVMGQQFFGEGGRAISAGFGAAIAATLIAPLNKRVHRWTENRFQKQLTALRHDLPKFVLDMRDVATLDFLVRGILDRVQQGVRAGHAAMILRFDGTDEIWCRDVAEQTVRDWAGREEEGTAPLVCDRDEPLFPMRVQLRDEDRGVIGWILLGRRPDGSFYGGDERHALVETAGPIARGIRVARDRATRLAEYAAANSALIQRIAALESRLESLTARAG